MAITSIFANISCADLARSTSWYATLFGREPDQTPMAGLAEWYVGPAGFQLYQDPGKAGRGTVTIIVEDVRQEHQRLSAEGFEPGAVQAADYTTITQMRDPDGNLVVLAQPGKA